MTKKQLGIFCLHVLVLLIFLVPLPSVHAQELGRFRTDYEVDYFLQEKDDNIATKVSFKIKITNLTSDLIIRRFSIVFPKSFQIGNIKANDDFQAVLPEVTEEEGRHVITVELSNPIAGLNRENNIYLDFLQYNLFKTNGNVWEVILPTIERKGDKGSYEARVHLPPNSGKQVSIAKPKPDHISLNEVVWKNPVNKTIYAVFGKQQNYTLGLRYHLQNPKITRVYTDIAFPPDTLYQKVYVNSIEPKPNSVFMDEDGNYLGRYYLNPKEDKTIYFSGAVSVFSQPRDEMKAPVKTMFEKERNYLLSPSEHWDLKSGQLPPGTDNIPEIYQYTINTLDYNYGRLNTASSRLGASQAAIYPDQAVCTEYSDLFIAIAREKGKYTREIQGYGFSNDQDLRPLSVNSDILHSWPEYYDTAIGLWIPVDPTWEDTSGIDYFDSFDLNHVVFAIHGKKSDYPYPAGAYKMDDSTKDINIRPSSQIVAEKKGLSFDTSPIQLPVFNKDSYSVTVTVQNTGNSFIWNLPLSASSDKLNIAPSTQIIDRLAPLQKKELTFEYKPNTPLTNTKAKLFLSSNEGIVYEHEISVTSFYFTLLKYAFIFTLAVSGLFVAKKLIKK